MVPLWYFKQIRGEGGQRQMALSCRSWCARPKKTEIVPKKKHGRGHLISLFFEQLSGGEGGGGPAGKFVARVAISN